MTVRVNKPEFNIREKLSELERPIGLKGSELMKSETAQEARDFVSAGRKNMIINGDMRISQRYNSSSRDIAGGNDEYILDRFICRESTGTSVRVQRNALSASTDPPGFRYALKYSALGNDTSLSGNEYARIQQLIETNNLKCDWGVHNTDYLTLSFWAKSNAPGKYYVNIEDSDASLVYLKPYYINQADTWQKIELTYPSPKEGSWITSTDNQIGLRITWSLGTGSTYQTTIEEGWVTSYLMAGPDQVNLLHTTGNAFWLTGVQLEVGKNATEFEHRSYGEELALCQRYYYEYPKGNTYNIIANGLANTSTNALFHFQYPVPMRSAPVVATSGNWQVIDGQSHSVSGFSAITDATELTGRVDATSSGLTAGRDCMLRNNNDANATFGFNAEL